MAAVRGRHEPPRYREVRMIPSKRDRERQFRLDGCDARTIERIVRIGKAVNFRKSFVVFTHVPLGALLVSLREAGWNNKMILLRGPNQGEWHFVPASWRRAA